jgi:hypothetical protein
MTFIQLAAAHPWGIIAGVALGLPIGMLLQRRHERREAARRNRAQVADAIEASRRWQVAQDHLNQSPSEAWAAAQRCGCADCVNILRTWTAN